MAISALPPVPLRSDTPANFIAKADAFLAALSTFRTEANAVAEAMNLGAVTANSATSLAIGAGSKSLTVDAAKSYVPGMTVKVAATADGTKWMLGDVTSYNSTTGALVVVVSVVQGSGTFAAWTVTQAAPGGAAPGANTDITSLNSPALGNATANTQTAGDNSTKVANTQFVTNAIATEDALLVHKTGSETISGYKTFAGGASFSPGAEPSSRNFCKGHCRIDAAGNLLYAFGVIASVTVMGTGYRRINLTGLSDTNYSCVPSVSANASFVSNTVNVDAKNSAPYNSPRTNSYIDIVTYVPTINFVDLPVDILIFA